MTTRTPPFRAQVTIVGRHDTDELMLLASDGLWDVLSNQVAPAPPPPPCSKGLPTTSRAGVLRPAIVRRRPRRLCCNCRDPHVGATRYCNQDVTWVGTRSRGDHDLGNGLAWYGLGALTAVRDLALWP